ncbi:MAG: UvrD-helicase domain-containing protein [Bacteroidetes bacterium]|nr:UvrD-helicase domain-containing protein [Bacteroidota bacterium]MDA1269028.1 UvrD-helicase domain-containing protein [Bacteroidota bacterium]
MAKPFLLYKSSAGSGKTYTLTLEYLKLALKNPNSGYRQILAVTFTNKATQEMKWRIVEVLECLSREVKPDKSLDKELMDHLDLDAEQLMLRARATLLNILHGYGHFAVSTIDSFFQKVIRSFAREMDLQAKFDVEMDTDAVLEKLVDRIVEKVADDPALRSWLIAYAEEQLLDGKSWDIRVGIKGLGKEIFQERFKAFRSIFQDSVGQDGFLPTLKEQIAQVRQSLVTEGKRQWQQAEDIRVLFGLEWTDFKGASSSFARQFGKLGDSKMPFPELTEKRQRELPDSSNWFTNGSPHEAAICNAFEAGLGELLQSWPEKLKLWNTYTSLQKNLNAFGVFRNLIVELRDLKDEEGILLISDVNDFLAEITRENEAPFLYEKIGNQYQHFLIDEFQDTSEFQWLSFKPLLQNSLASGHTNLLVGDVKQSIYRWRGGKLELLLSEVQEQIHPDFVEVKNLSVNYRSLPGIIAFNNAVFKQLPELMERGMENHYNLDPENKLSKAFEGVVQEVSESKKDEPFKGKIHLEFTEKSSLEKPLDEENEEEEGVELGVLEKLPILVKQLQDQGYALRDIAFLVRTNGQGAILADTFMEEQRTQTGTDYRFDVLSEESLFIDKSIAVKCMLGFLTYLSAPSDRVALKTLWQYYALVHNIPLSHELFYVRDLPLELQEKESKLLRMQASFQQMPLIELVEQGLTFLGLTQKQQDLSYVSGFKEAVFDFVKKNRADLLGFLDWWELNKKKRTVKIPEDHDAMRILTIHKAKGLEFKVVVMPFMDWGIVFSGLQAPILWAPFEAENGMQTVVPLTHQNLLKKSHFAGAYDEEVRLSYLDSLNLLYVAFTRAEEAFFGFSTYSIAKSKKEISPTRTGNILYTLFSGGFQFADEVCSSWNSEALTFDWGQWLKTVKNDDHEIMQVPLLRWDCMDWKSKLNTKTYPWDFSLEGICAREQRDFGVIIHDILADAQGLEDAIRLLKEYTFDGRWEEDTAAQIKVKLEQLFALPQVKSWFYPDLPALTEQGILEPGGTQKRPDRILIAKDEALVIDFKTGVKRDSHVLQVREYMILVQTLTQLPVKGYLCYLEPTEIIEL